jgi:deoxyribonuclease V
MIHHRWDISPFEAIALQRRLAALVRVEPLVGEVHTVGGTDCAFMDGGKRIIAVAVLCDAKSMEVLTSVREIRRCGFPMFRDC